MKPKNFPGKVIVILLILINYFCFPSANAQDLSKISFTTEFSSKFSVGKEVRDNFEYEPGFTINYPKNSTYNIPVYCLKVGPNYDLTKRINVGIGAGIAVAQNINDPLIPNQYFNRVMFPFSIHLGYTADLGHEVSLMPKYEVGYQFLISQFGGTVEGFIYEQTGGLLMAAGFDLSKKIGKYSPFLNVGYELNMVNNNVSLGWIDGYEYLDKYRFSTSYHLFKIGVGVKY